MNAIITLELSPLTLTDSSFKVLIWTSSFGFDHYALGPSLRSEKGKRTRKTPSKSISVPMDTMYL